MSISVNPNDIKALALDLDGTILAPGEVLTERTIRAVHACRQRGLRIIINTGRTVEGAEPFRRALGLEGPMIYCNGALVLDMPEGRLLSMALLDKETAEFCADLSRETGAYYQAVFPAPGQANRTILMAERGGPERDMYFKHSGRQAEIGDIKEALNHPDQAGCIKGMFLAEPEVQAALRLKIEERFGRRVYITQTLRTFLEIMDTNASKGRGLELVMERCALTSRQILAFGDEENDLPMFTAAGFSAAPANAKDSVKAAANLVIGSNADNGVAVFLEEFFGF